jgi:uncharacterized oxidoreductase
VPTYPAETLTSFARSLFVRAGVPDDEARIVSESLIDSNLCGHDSHGLIRVLQYIGFLRDGELRSGVPLAVLNETPALLALDGNWGLGQVQAYRTLERLLPKAKSLGISVATLKQCGHIGRLGEYAEWAARHQLALIATVNSHGSGQRVAPPGGTQGRISTNPLCLGAPTPADPLVLDIGTSACAEGKVRVSYQKGEAIPEGWVIDSKGQPCTDPSVLYTEPRGTILPFGGPQAYKGFGLGLLLDVLAGGLSGGKCTNPESPMPGVGNSVLMMLLDPKQFAGFDHFLDQSGKLTEYVRSSPCAEGVERITLPGDPERLTKEKRLREGIAISDGTWQLLAKLAGELGVQVP